MKRRRLLVGLGGLTTGLSTVFGAGAFSNTQANRELSVSVVNDDDAYLRFSDTHTAGNGQMYATWRDGMVTFRFGEHDGIQGSGLGKDSIYRFEDVFVIENQGTQEVSLYGEYTDDEVEDIELIQTSDVNEVGSGDGGMLQPVTRTSQSDGLKPGDKALFGLIIDTTESTFGSKSTSIEITAQSVDT